MANETCTNIAFPVCCPFDTSPDDGGPLASSRSVTTGPRYGRFFNSSADTNVILTWDFYEPVTADFLYIANLHCVDLNELLEIRLRSSDDNVLYNTELSITPAFTFTGITETDILECFAETGAHQYWQVEFIFNSPQQVLLSKIYFGKTFNFNGVEPNADIVEERQDREDLRFLRTVNANVYRARDLDVGYQYEFTYAGIPDIVVNDFLQKIYYHANTYTAIFNQSFQEMLNGHEVLHGIITDVEFEKVGNNLNEVRFLFTEMVG